MLISCLVFNQSSLHSIHPEPFLLLNGLSSKVKSLLADAVHTYHQDEEENTALLHPNGRWSSTAYFLASQSPSHPAFGSQEVRTHMYLGKLWNSTAQRTSLYPSQLPACSPCKGARWNDYVVNQEWKLKKPSSPILSAANINGFFFNKMWFIRHDPFSLFPALLCNLHSFQAKLQLSCRTAASLLQSTNPCRAQALPHHQLLLFTSCRIIRNQTETGTTGLLKLFGSCFCQQEDPLPIWCKKIIPIKSKTSLSYKFHSINLEL